MRLISAVTAVLTLLPVTPLLAALPARDSATLTRFFPNVSFTAPVLMLEAPGDSDRLYVFERAGRVKYFLRSNPTQVFTYLDISAQVASYHDLALNGAAFHPDFQNNGELYLHYNWSKGLGNPAGRTDPEYGTARISRFTASSAAATTIDPSTEEILHSHPKPYLFISRRNQNEILGDHNGGSIEFGPDGMMYIAFGDGGSHYDFVNTDPDGQDPLRQGQNPANVFGSILRIDVTGEPDSGKLYAVPPDNPFVAGGPVENTLPEIWAYGFRNPWRIAFDPGGRLICVDVGMKSREEIDHVLPGQNYGWSVMEGDLCLRPGEPCNPEDFTAPIIVFPWTNEEFRSLTGGYTYTGTREPSLNGKFLFADAVMGGVYAMEYDGGTATAERLVPQSAPTRFAGFGRDSSGEVYLLDYFTGGVFVLDLPDPPSHGATWAVE
ncbi:hypothetical protein GC173_11955 [bacterium]|nr:hypothetical protein [bacterium]